MNDKKHGSERDPQQIQNEKRGSVIGKAIDAVAEAFRNGSAETTIVHWPEPAYETAENRSSGNGRDTVTYTFERVEKPEKNSKDKKKKIKKDKKKLKKLEKKLEKKLKKEEKKARKKEKTAGKQAGPPIAPEHNFNEAGPYGPGGL